MEEFEATSNTLVVMTSWLDWWMVIIIDIDVGFLLKWKLFVAAAQ